MCLNPHIDPRVLRTLEAFHNLGFWSFDRTTRTVEISARAVAFFGDDKAAEVISFRRFLEIVDKRDRAPLRQGFIAALANGTPFLKIVSLRPVKGQARRLKLSVESEKVDGRVVAIWGIVEDVTEASMCRREERRARRSERRLIDAIDSMDDGFAVYDRHGRLVRCNEQYRQLYRRSAPAMVPGARFDDIIRYGLAHGQYPDAIGNEEEWLRERIENHLNPPENAFEQRLPNGKWVRVRETTTPDGGRAGFRADITPLKSLERQLAMALLEARSAGQLQRAMLPNLAHEMRTPLNAIIGFSQLIALKLGSQGDNGQLTDYCVDIEQSGRHLLGMIDNLLDLARIGQSVDRDDADVTSLRTVLEQAERVVAFQLGSSRKTLLRKGNADVRVLGNQTKMAQVILNLLSNALKYSGRGETIRMEVDDRDARFVTVWVIDNGPGIPEAARSNLFQRYERLTAEGTSIPGTGLGLAIAREFVEGMGGRIGVETAPGGGAAFWVAFRREEILARPRTRTERLRA